MTTWEMASAKIGFAPDQMTDEDNEFFKAYKDGIVYGLMDSRSEIWKELRYQEELRQRALGVGQYDRAESIRQFIDRLAVLHEIVDISMKRYGNDRGKVAGQ